MLNSKNYDEVLACTPGAAKAILVQKMSKEALSFNNLLNFPSEYGLYFIVLGEEVLYIGKADKQTIKDRCNQYINNSSGGTLRKKIESVKSCTADQAINYIKSHLCAKFITSIDTDKLAVVEEVAIWAFQSKLNVIKPTTFQYDKLNVV